MDTVIVFIFLGFGVCILTVVSTVIYVRGTHVADRTLSWFAGDRRPSPTEEKVYRAYLQRHNMGRLLGGVICTLIGLVVILRSSGELNGITIGPGTMPGNLLIWWLGGMVLGTLLTESYRLSPRNSSAVRLAVLDARPPRPLPKVVASARVAAIMAAMVGVLATWTWADGSVCASALFAILILVLSEVTQRAITDRPRPTSEPAITVDERLRWFAGSSLAWLELAGTALGLASTLAAVTPLLPPDEPWFDPVYIALICIPVALLAVTLYALFNSSMRPRRTWRPTDSLDDYARIR